MKQGIFRNMTNGRGRPTWRVQILSDEKPEIGEEIEVVKKGGRNEIVSIVSVSETAPWVCQFRSESRADSAQTRVAVAGSDFLGSGASTDSEVKETNLTVSALPEQAQQAVAALQALFGGFDENKVRAIVASAVRDATQEATQNAHAAVAEAKQVQHEVSAARAKVEDFAQAIPQMAVEALTKAAQSAVGIRVEYVDVAGKVHNAGRQHKQFANLLRLVSIGENVWLPGPAGSGKTSAARAVAQALELPFYHSGKIMMEHQALGYKDANGVYHTTPFREAYEKGGVFLQDECDGSEAKALLPLNMGLENGEMAFPDRIVQAHRDFRCIAAANTFGLGGDSDYVGRNRLDAAFLDRFDFLPWEYDEDFEQFLALQVWEGAAGWVQRVQSLRRNAKARGIRVLITPRASLKGAKLLKAGVSQSNVEQWTVRKAMTRAQWEGIQ